MGHSCCSRRSEQESSEWAGKEDKGMIEFGTIEANTSDIYIQDPQMSW